MKTADIFVKQLEEEGVEYIFGIPGEENLLFMDSIRKSKIKPIITRHEQAAAFMAATYGRLTGKAGVCFSTLGPGATNLITGIAHAQLVGAPLVSISGQKALRDNWQAKFQLIDIVDVMRPITKKSVSIADPDQTPTVIRDAFKIAESERPGAVHIEFPEDVADEKTNSKIQRKSRVRRAAPDPKAIAQAVELINKSKNPLIIISAGANRKMVSKQLYAFIKNTGIYTVETQMGKGIIPSDCKYSLLSTGIHKQDYVNCGINQADLIITVGYNIVEYPPYVWNKELDKKIIHIDFLEADVDRYYDPTVEIVGDISHTFYALRRKITKKRCFPIFKKTRELVQKKIYADYKKGEVYNPPQIVSDVRAVMGKDDIVTLDNGIYKLWFSRMYNTYKPNTLILDNALATMGAGLPSAIAAKIVHPDKKVLAVVGDGGFMMNSQELETAIRYNIPVVVLILNDNAFGFIKWKQKNMGLKNYSLDYTNPDFVKYAQSYGAVGMKINKGDDLKAALTKAFKLKKVVVIECPIDYTLNYDIFSQELGKLVCNL